MARHSSLETSNAHSGQRTFDVSFAVMSHLAPAWGKGQGGRIGHWLRRRRTRAGKTRRRPRSLNTGCDEIRRREDPLEAFYTYSRVGVGYQSLGTHRATSSAPQSNLTGRSRKTTFSRLFHRQMSSLSSLLSRPLLERVVRRLHEFGVKPMATRRLIGTPSRS